MRRHPAAEALDEWFEDEGREMARLETLTRGPYLENRLKRAFMAGWNAAGSHAIQAAAAAIEKAKG